MDEHQNAVIRWNVKMEEHRNVVMCWGPPKD
jgi:hypothetical protein